MKKKILVYIMMLILVFIFTACSKHEPPTASESETTNIINLVTDNKANEDTKKEVARPTVRFSENLFDTEFSINGKVIKLPIWHSDFNAEGLTTKSNPDIKLYSQGADHFYWTLDNIDFSGYLYNGSINVLPINQCIIQELKITSRDTNDKNEILFSKNIQLNVSTKNDIIAAYGEPTRTYEKANDTRLSYQSEETGNINIFFLLDKETNILIGATITNNTYVEFDNTVSEEVTPLFDYIAPTQLSDHFDNKVFMIHKKYYSLPCPVQEFLDNGFVISESYEDVVINAGGYNACEFELDGKTIFTYVSNFSEVATPIINCNITTILYENPADDSTLIAEFSPGIKLGDSEEKLLTALADTEYMIQELENGTLYYLGENGRQGMWPYSINFQVVVADDAINHIYFSNEKIPTYDE